MLGLPDNLLQQGAIVRGGVAEEDDELDTTKEAVSDLATHQHLGDGSLQPHCLPG